MIESPPIVGKEVQFWGSRFHESLNGKIGIVVAAEPFSENIEVIFETEGRIFCYKGWLYYLDDPAIDMAKKEITRQKELRARTKHAMQYL